MLAENSTTNADAYMCIAIVAGIVIVILGFFWTVSREAKYNAEAAKAKYNAEAAKANNCSKCKKG